jgi:hypothetical protein
MVVKGDEKAKAKKKKETRQRRRRRPKTHIDEPDEKK